MDKNIVIREYREGDEVSIMKLRGLVLSGSKDMDWWVWQYKQNPAGEPIIIVAEDGDTNEIVSHFSYIPLRMKIENNIIYAVTSVDLMVHPNYRGLGIYNKSRLKGLGIARQKGYIFEYSFPNLDMLPINRKYGIRPVFKKTPLWVKTLHFDNVVAKYLNNHGILTSFVKAASMGLMRVIDRSRNYQITTQLREINKIDERFDTLWQEASSHHKITLVRDRAYLEWRYIKKPGTEYTIYIAEQDIQLRGYIILRIVEENGLRIGWIVDILTRSKHSLVMMDLIGKAIQYFRMLKIDVILCVIPPSTYLATSIKKFGFLMLSRWRRQEFQIVCVVITPKYHESLLYNPNHWYLTRGDSDLV